MPIDKEQQILDEITEWIEKNRHQLPLNVDALEINVLRNDEINSLETDKIIIPFYKPYSKIILLKDE